MSGADIRPFLYPLQSTGRFRKRKIKHVYASLTPREREVMGHVIAGSMNRQIATSLGLQDLVRKAEALGVEPVGARG